MIKLIKKADTPICLISGNMYYFAMANGDIFGVNIKNRNIKDNHKLWIAKIDEGVKEGLYSEEELSDNYRIEILCGMSMIRKDN